MDVTPPRHLVISKPLQGEDLEYELERLRRQNLTSKTFYIRNHHGRYDPFVITVRDVQENNVVVTGGSSPSTNDDLSESGSLVNFNVDEANFTSEMNPLEGTSKSYSSGSARNGTIADIVDYVQPRIKRKRTNAIEESGFGQDHQAQPNLRKRKVPALKDRIILSTKHFDFVLRKSKFNTNRKFDVNGVRYMMGINFHSNIKKMALIHTTFPLLAKSLNLLLTQVILQISQLRNMSIFHSFAGQTSIS